MPDGRLINTYPNRTEVILQSGAKRAQFLDGYSIVHFENGDIRQVYPDGRAIYLYKEAGVTQSDMPSGERVILFGNGQLEKLMKDGSK